MGRRRGVNFQCLVLGGEKKRTLCKPNGWGGNGMGKHILLYLKKCIAWAGWSGLFYLWYLLQLTEVVCCMYLSIDSAPCKEYCVQSRKEKVFGKRTACVSAVRCVLFGLIIHVLLFLWLVPFMAAISPSLLEVLCLLIHLILQ